MGSAGRQYTFNVFPSEWKGHNHEIKDLIIHMFTLTCLNLFRFLSDRC